MKSELSAAIAEADMEIAEKVAEGEKIIQEIRSNALESVEEVAKSTASALVVALGGKDDTKSIEKAVLSQIKE